MKLQKLLDDPRLSGLIQFIKFGVVGVSNTAISYAVEMLCYYVFFANISWPDARRVMVASVLAFVVSVTNSYYWNNRYVFKSEGRKTTQQHLAAYLRMVTSYALTGLIIAPTLKLRFIGLGLWYWLAAIVGLIVTVPLNFVMNKFWAFRNQATTKIFESK